MTNTNTWRGVTAMIVTATAVSMLWLLGCAWIGSLVGVFLPRSGMQESVSIGLDETPLIASRRWNDYEAVTYRTLEGEQANPPEDAWLYAPQLPAIRRPAGVIEPPISWSTRIVGATGWSRPGVSWYLVRDDRRPGRACFEVFDLASDDRIGFYGREGIRQTIPDKKEWFDVGLNQFGWGEGSSYTGTSVRGAAEYVWSSGIISDNGAITPWMFYLQDGDAILEIDLRKKTHRILHTLEGLTALSTIYEPLPTIETDKEKTESTLMQAIRSDPKRKQRIAIRNAESIALVDPKTDHVDTVQLPEWAHDRDFRAYSLGEGRLILTVNQGNWSGGPIQEIVWINAAGEEQRRERIELAGYVPPTERSKAWTMTGVLPMPIASAAYWFGYRPFELMQKNASNSYADSVRRSTEESWPARVVVFVLGLAVAAAVFLLHRKSYRSQAAAWAVTAGLLGPAGLLAYLLSWRRPPKVECASCGRTVPRDREACPACGAEWQLPSPNGVEIFDLEAA